MRPFDAWVTAGRPVTPAQPIADLVAQLKAAYPDGANQFGWYADDSHYEADPPLDHTPYSADAWPRSDPHWVVFATDIMVDALPGGLDEAQRLFDHWLAEARAGRAPWIKYLIWQGQNYDVRNDWQAAEADNHYDHIHLSARTDFQDYSLDSWSVVPEDDMQIQDLWNANTASATHPVTFIDKFNQLARDAANANAGVVALTAVIEQLAATIRAGGGAVDTKAILSGVDERLAALRLQVRSDVRDAVGDEPAGTAPAVPAPPAVPASTPG